MASGFAKRVKTAALHDARNVKGKDGGGGDKMAFSVANPKAAKVSSLVCIGREEERELTFSLFDAFVFFASNSPGSSTLPTNPSEPNDRT